MDPGEGSSLALDWGCQAGLLLAKCHRRERMRPTLKGSRDKQRRVMDTENPGGPEPWSQALRSSSRAIKFPFHSG